MNLLPQYNIVYFYIRNLLSVGTYTFGSINLLIADNAAMT